MVTEHKLTEIILKYENPYKQIVIPFYQIEQMVEAGEALQKAYTAVQAAKRIANIKIPE